MLTDGWPPDAAGDDGAMSPAGDRHGATRVR